MARLTTAELSGKGGMLGRAGQFAIRAEQMFKTAEKPAAYHFRDRKMNLAYYFGRQDIVLDERGRWHPIRANDTDNGDDAKYVVNNVVRKMLDDRISVVCGSNPTIEAVPTSSEQSDLFLASVATKNADAFWRYLNLSLVFEEAHRQAGIYSTSFVKFFWDEFAGQYDELARKPMGDVGVSILHPNRVIIDPAAQRVMPWRKMPSDAAWLFELQVVDVNALYGNDKLLETHEEKNELTGESVVYCGLPQLKELAKTKRSVPTEDESAMLQQLDRDPDSETENVSLFSGKKPEDWRDGGFVRLAFYYEHPNPSSPRGRFAAFLPDNDWWPIEYREELPFATADNPIGFVPIVQLRDLNVPGTPYGKSRMTEAREIQDQINCITSQWFNDAQRFTPYTILDEDAGIDEDAMRDASVSRMLLWRSSTMGQKPELVFPSGNMAEMRNSIETLSFLIRQAEDKMQIHAVKNHPKSNPTATELQMVRTDDLRVLEALDVRRAEEEAYGPGIRAALRIANWGYSEERAISFRNDENAIVTKAFKASDLSFRDISIRQGSSMPKNRTMQKMDAFQMAQQGFFVSNDPAEQRRLRREYRELIGFTTVDELDHDVLDSKNAKSAFQSILAGQPVNIYPRIDNHKIHIEVLFGELKKPAFMNLPEDEKARVYKETIDLIEQHEEMEANETQATGISPGVEAEVALSKKGMTVPATQAMQLAGSQRNAENGLAGAMAPQETNKTGGQTRGLG